MLLQREGDVFVTRGRLYHRATAGGSHDVLFAVNGVSGRCGMSRCVQLGLPEHLAGVKVDGSEVSVRGRTDEDEATGSYSGAARVFGAGDRNAARG